MDTPHKPTAPRPTRFTYDAATKTTLRFAVYIAFVIAVPAFIFGFGGAYLDKALGSAPAFLMFGFLLSMIISGVIVIGKVRAFIAEHTSTPHS